MLLLDLGVANHDAAIIKLLRSATEYSPSSQSSGPTAMEKITDALQRCPDDYFHVSFHVVFYFYHRLLNVNDFNV